MNDFQYVRVETLAEASELLAADPDGTRLIAGGTDVIVFMMDQRLRPRMLVDAKRIAGLDHLTANGELALGPFCRMRELERRPEVRRRWAALADGAREVGGVAIRCRATIAGNLGTASPAADTPPALLALGAVVEVLGSHGPRAVPLCEFFAGPGQHNLQPGEVITGVRLPAPAARSGSAYLKLGTRKAMDIAFVGVAAYLALEDDGTVAEARVGLGAVAPTPRLAAGMTEVLSGRPLDDEAIELAARTAMESASPITDRRCSAEYRRAMTGELTRRALRLAAARAEA